MRIYVGFIIFCFWVTFLIGQNREVAIYYDNSGSMNYEENLGACEAVNYATQLMISLLHPKDKITIYKTDGKVINIPLGSPEQRKRFLEIVNGFECNSKYTPSSMLLEAVEELQNSDANEKWLIVFTDGTINTEIQESRRIVEKWYSEGKMPPSLLLLINKGKSGNVVEFVKTPYVHNSSANYLEIISELNQIGKDILGITYTTTNQQVRFFDRKIEVNTLLPLRRILVVEQKAGEEPNKVLSAKMGDEILSYNSFFDVSKQQRDENETLLSARTTHIHMPQVSSIIPQESNITIELANQINRPQDFQVYLEAAVDAKVIFQGLKNGKTKEEIRRCPEIDRVYVQFKLINTNTKDPIPLEVLEETEAFVRVGEDKVRKLKRTEDYFEIYLEADEDTLKLDLSAYNEDYLNLKGIQYQIVKEDSCVADKLMLESNVSFINTSLASVDTINPIVITPTLKTPANKARPLYQNELENVIAIEADENGPLNIHLSKIDSQRWELSLNTSWCLCFMPDPEKKIRLKARLNQKNNIQSVPLEIPFDFPELSFWGRCGNTIISIILLVIMSTYIIGIIRKKRFDPNAKIVVKEPYKDRELGIKLATGFVNRWIIPFKTEEQKIKGVLFRAHQYANRVILPKEILNDNMKLDGVRLEKGLKRDQILTQQKLLEVERGDSTITYRFERKRKSKRKKR